MVIKAHWAALVTACAVVCVSTLVKCDRNILYFDSRGLRTGNCSQMGVSEGHAGARGAWESHEYGIPAEVYRLGLHTGITGITGFPVSETVYHARYTVFAAFLGLGCPLGSLCCPCMTAVSCRTSLGCVAGAAQMSCATSCVHRRPLLPPSLLATACWLAQRVCLW